MKIDNLVRIIDGNLQTHPSIDAFERIIFDANRILRGDLFIDVDENADNAKLASEKGAYAIISTRPFDGDDSELAWICVTSIEQALIKLLRYQVAEKSLECLLLTPIQATFLEMTQSPKTIKIVQGSLLNIVQHLLRMEEGEKIGIIDPLLCHSIAPTAHKIKNYSQTSWLAKGLFLSSFWHKERYWNDQKIPSLFKDDFLSLLHFCDTNGIAYTLENLFFGEHFYPQFVTPSLRKKEFGSSDKVLIFEPSSTLLAREIDYLEKQCEEHQWILCLPKSMENLFTCKARIIGYEKSMDLDMLKEEAFLYALILGHKEDFEPLLTQSFMIQPSLF